MSSNNIEPLSSPNGLRNPDDDDWTTQKLRLQRKKHIKRLVEGLKEKLPPVYQKLVPAQTWTIYWITQSLALLERNNDLDASAADVIGFISQCANSNGGYGGGPGQISHLATSYAAVNALVSLSSEEALESIDRLQLIKFMHCMKQPNGSFMMHDDGEIDARASYCAIAILKCLNIEDHFLTEGTADWLLTCQTYEGGFGSVPGSEAHGGYTFCCVAGLSLLNQLHRCDLPSLLRWLTNKQLTVEGGFAGRSNKLVDSCYSFWQGAVFPLIHPLLFDHDKNAKPGTSTVNDKDAYTSDGSVISGRTTTKKTTRRSSIAAMQNNFSKEPGQDTCVKEPCPPRQWLFNCYSLQEYILDSCQAKGGLLKDKPGAVPDFYHTCYALGGLSISQYGPDGLVICNSGSHAVNLLAPTHPLFNLTLDSLNFCYEYFENKKIQTLRKTSGARTATPNPTHIIS